MNCVVRFRDLKPTSLSLFKNAPRALSRFVSAGLAGSQRHHPGIPGIENTILIIVFHRHLRFQKIFTLPRRVLILA
jgi:hypothetical protein